MAKKPACSRFLRRNGQTQKPKRFRHTGGETTAEQFLVSSPVQGKAPIHAVKRYEILEMPSARIIAQDDADSFYSFGPFRLDPRSLVLTKDGLRVPLTSKATEVLLQLVERNGTTVAKAELRAAVWGASPVEDNNLNQCVSAIRKALGERPGEHQYLMTVTGVGYRFVASVACVSKEQSGNAKPAEPIASGDRRRPVLFAATVVIVVAVLAGAWIAPHGRATPPTNLEVLPHNREALEPYLTGRRIERGRSLADLDQAIQLFQRAIDKDPKFALAYAALADAYGIKVANGLASPENLRAGETAATQALALDPTLADAHSSLGLLKYARWDWRGAEREYERALRLDPSNARALMRSAMVSFVLGRFSEAESRLHKAQLLNPSNGAITGMLCELYYYSRRYGDCIRQADQIIQFDPADEAFAWLRKTAALVQLRRFPEAGIAARNYAKAAPNEHINSQVLLLWASSRGDRTAFEPRYREILKAHSGQYYSPYDMAATYAGIGDKENAFRELEIAYQQHVTDLVSLKWEPMFDSIRSDPRYANLLDRMGLSARN